MRLNLRGRATYNTMDDLHRPAGSGVVVAGCYDILAPVARHIISYPPLLLRQEPDRVNTLGKLPFHSSQSVLGFCVQSVLIRYTVSTYIIYRVVNGLFRD